MNPSGRSSRSAVLFVAVALLPVDSLANYFYTSNGLNLVDVLRESFQLGIDRSEDVRIEA